MIVLVGRAVTRMRARAGATLPPWLEGLALALLTAALAGIGILRYVDYAGSGAYRQAYHSTADDWSVILSGRGPVAVTALGPQGWAGEFVTLFAPRAQLCVGRWGDTWSRCPPAALVIFDSDLADADLYRRATHLTVHPGTRFEGTPTFWYVQGAHLPDPAAVVPPLIARQKARAAHHNGPHAGAPARPSQGRPG